jgi:molybdopterin converting factor small subunit
LRLFARAREAAGTGRASFEAATLGALLGEAVAQFGTEFREVLDASRVWVNGDVPADGDATPLHDGDEVAVLPPVSGGQGGPVAVPAAPGEAVPGAR